jgi:hypothetical protein
MTHFYWLALAVLSVWRITHLLHAENGPWNLLARLRRLSAAGFWSSLFDCFYCLSLWVAAPFALLVGEGWKERLLLMPALSGGAILLERLNGCEDASAPAAYFEEQEKVDVRVREDEDEPASDVELTGNWGGSER